MIQRTTIGTSATATVTWGDAVAADPTGSACTVTVTTATGTALATAVAGTRSATGVYGWAMTPRSQTDILTLVWSATISGQTETRTRYLEVAGGWSFSLLELTGATPGLASYSVASLESARIRAENDIERILGFALVPRCTSETIVATNANVIRPTWGRIRSVRSLTVNGDTVNVADVDVVGDYVEVAITPGDTVAIVYEHGLGAPPNDLAEATMTLARVRAQAPQSAIPDRAERFTGDNGRTFELSVAGARRTGLPEVDAVLHRYQTAAIA